MTLLANGADLLVHEALDATKVRSELLTWNASAESVGALAAQAKVGQLVLTHLLPPPNNDDGEQAFLDQARLGGYEGPIQMAIDLLRFPLDR